MDETSIPVVVTTEHRGVFFGYLPDGKVVSEAGTFDALQLKQARNITYWSADVRGFLGLAATGPSKDCRVGPAVPSLTLAAITSVAQCTPEAAANWEAGPWSR